MAHPKRKHSKGRRDKRRANWKLSAVEITSCPQCASPVKPHHVCAKCGYYRGKRLVVIKEKKPKETAASK